MRRISLHQLTLLGLIFLTSLAALQLDLHRHLPVALLVSQDHIWIALNMLAWAIGSVFAARLIQAFGWDQIGRKTGRHAPYLLIQLTNMLIYATAAFAMAATLFEIPLTGAIATSSVLGLVVGFAVKSLISDTFSGIALHLDQGFAINDFILITGRPGTVRILGRVTEINWRSTYIETPENTTLIIPNTVVSESIVMNLSRPDTTSEFELLVTIDFAVPSERAIRVLTAAANAAGRENQAVWDCRVRISEINATGISYKIKFMLDPSKLGPGKARNLILSHVERQMKVTGLAPAQSKIENWVGEDSAADRDLDSLLVRTQLLGKVPLFAPFVAEERAQLAQQMRLVRFAPGTQLVRAGEPGRSMFLLAEGLVSVLLPGSGQEVDIATLCPGDFFGEMSMLTGEPRSATVIAISETIAFDIDKDHIGPLLDARPEAAARLANIVAERQTANGEASSKKSKDAAKETGALTRRILDAMLSFFGRVKG